MTRIRIRNSTVPGAVPSSDQLVAGELAVNVADGKLFLKRIEGAIESIVEIGSGGGGGPTGASTPLPTPGTLVLRDANGSFAGNTITANSFVGALSGNADTASKWATPQDLTLSGDLLGNVSIDGSGPINLVATIKNSAVTAGTYGSGFKVPVITVDQRGIVTNATTVDISASGTPENVANQTVRRDGNGNFWAGTITVNRVRLNNPVVLTLSGDLTGNVSMDGNSVTLEASVLDDSHSHSIETLPGLDTLLALKVDVANYTPEKVLNMVKEADGPSSGLDADMLDGFDSEYFLNASNLAFGILPEGRLPAFEGDIQNQEGSKVIALTTTGVEQGTYGSSSLIPVITVNEKGRVTAASSVPLTLAGFQYVRKVQVHGDGITQETSSPSGGVVDITLATDTALTPNTIVYRDESGSFSANVITATLEGSATSAGKWTNAITLELDGDLAGNVSIDGSGNATLTAALVPEQFAGLIGDMVSDNEEAGISVTYNPATQKIDFDVQDFTLTFAGAVSGSAAIANLQSTTVTLALTTGAVELGAQTNGPYVANITVDAPEDTITVSANKPEGATYEIKLNASAEDSATSVVYRDSNGWFAANSFTANSITVNGQTTANGNIMMYGTGGLKLPVGTTAQREGLPKGTIRYNGELDRFEARVSNMWISIVDPGIGGYTRAVSDETITGNWTFTGNLAGDLTGNVTGNLTGDVTGNVSGSANTLATPRTFTFNGAVIGNAVFDGSEDVTIETTLANGVIELGVQTLGDYVKTIEVSGTGLSVTNTGAVGGTHTVTLDAQSVSVANTLVARDGNGDVEVYTLRADTVIANMVTANFQGNAETADKLKTARIINLMGDVTGNVAFDGSNDVNLNTTLSVLLATSEALPNKVVRRDANASFSANVITATLNGNAATALQWTTARTINLAGDLLGNVTIDGSANATLTATIAPNSVALGADTVGNYVGEIKVTGNGIQLSNTGGLEGGVFSVNLNAQSTALPSSLVYRDAAGNFEANIITANVVVAGDLVASSAEKWSNSITLTLTGDVTGNASIDGSTNVSITTTIPPNSIILGTDTSGIYVGGITVFGNGVTISNTNTAGGIYTITANTTSAAVSNTIVFRDANGSFSANAITGTALSSTGNLQVGANASVFGTLTAGSIALTGNLSVNALTANSLAVNGTVTSNTVSTNSIFQNVVSLTGNTIDLTLGNFFTTTVTSAVSFTFSGVTSGASGFMIKVVNGGAFSVTWPTSVKWSSGVAPVLTASGTDYLAFFTDDGGTNWRGMLSIKDSK